jgi:hypothetical protein
MVASAMVMGLVLAHLSGVPSAAVSKVVGLAMDSVQAEG